MNRSYFNRFSRRRKIEAVVFGLVLIFFAASCGKKGDPFPPRELPPPAVGDLAMERSDDFLTLTWTVPTGKKRIVSGFAGFLVYRSKKAVSEEACKGCPILFSRVADVPISGEAPGDAMTFSETLEKGFRYIYKVTIYSKAGLVSGASNLVEFTY
ncbi:MAG TPA: hypothetical protein HPQ03_08950 [Deltaproteobacteria bacterium]|nr:hypothetical protein [Deltaproteobacteria bacterium]